MNTYFCIDLKSFYASVECVDRGLDPFTTNLVVADPTRGPGALCLAVSPGLKALGVRNRCRIFEIPPSLAYITAMPHMRRYMEMSAYIYSLYLEYLAKEDVYPYSIDECFFNASPYLSLYGGNGETMAKMLMDFVFEKTGICATAGVGPNLFLAKIAMDMIAKHVPSHIGVLDEKRFREQIWHHRPITDIWNIGNGTARRLARMGIYDLYGVTRLSEETLYRVFGKNAAYLIDHAWGRESCTLSDIMNYRPKKQSLHNSQVLFRDYTFSEARLIMEEMTHLITGRLIKRHAVAGGLGISIHYSKDVAGRSRGSMTFYLPTDSPSKIMKAMHALYDRKVKKGLPIRVLSISLSPILAASDVPAEMNLFEPPDQEKKETAVERAVLEIQEKYGKNAIFYGDDLRKEATVLQRNLMIGGHHA